MPIVRLGVVRAGSWPSVSPVHVVTLASLWGIFIRFVAPVAVTIAFLHAIGWLKL